MIRLGWRAHNPRAESVTWAQAVMADHQTVFLDTETTGLGRDAEIVDLAIVSRDGRPLLNTLVRPDGPIPLDASRIHGITDADVRTAPTLRELLPDLVRALDGRRVIIYNAAYDRPYLERDCRRHGAMPRVRVWECAMLQYARYRGEIHPRHGDYRWHKLVVACAAFGVLAGEHRALADALACRAVVMGMANAPAPPNA